MHVAQHGGLAQTVGQRRERGERQRAPPLRLEVLIGRQGVAREALGLCQRLEMARAQDVERLASYDAAQPRRKRRRLRQPRQAPPCRHERLLDDVACALGVAQERERGAERQSLMTSHQLGEGVDVTGPGPLHQRDQVHAASRDRQLARSPYRCRRAAPGFVVLRVACAPHVCAG